MTTNLTSVLEIQAAQRPGQPALVHGHGAAERMITFGDLAAQVELAAAGWRAAGLRAGDPVLIFHPMSVDLYIALLGLMRGGMVAVFVDPTAGFKQLAHAREKLPPKAILASRLTSVLCRVLPALWGAGPVLTPAKLVRLGAAAPAELREVADTTPDSSALVTWTSGSTGRPKGIVRSHGFLLLQHRLLAKHLDLKPGEVDLTALPVFALANLASGVTSVFLPGKAGKPAQADPQRLGEQILKWKITRSAGSPALYERLAEGPPEAVRQMAAIYTGGAPVFPRLLQRLRELNRDLLLVCVYGSTEAEPIAHADWEGPRAGGFGLYQGHRVEEVELAVIAEPAGDLSAEEFAKLRRPPGLPGEIVVAGEHVIHGYLNGVGDSETKFRVDGRVWHRTGDAGYLDTDGGLWLLGRASALGAGEHRPEDYPFAVEVAAMESPEVERAALIEHEGRRILFVQGTAGDVAGRLDWARLDEVRVIDRIPLDRRHQAKVDYTALRKLT